MQLLLRDATLRTVGATLIVLGVHTTPAAAIDLLRSYELALQNDGQLKASRARAEGGREALPQATAQLLPNVSGSAAYGQTQQRRTLSGLSDSQTYASHSAGLSLRQPIYRKQLFGQYDEAKAKVIGVDAELDRDTQALGVRVATSYFDALFAGDSLELILAQKASYEAQLRAAKLAFAAGTGTRTDIDETQARLDGLLADEIRARQQIGSAILQLQIYVGEPIKSLSTLDPARFKPQEHDPKILDDWVSRALAYNPELRAQKAKLDAALSEIEIAKGGHLPSLDLVAQISDSVGDSTQTIPRTENRVGYVGLQLNVPIFSGGYVSSVVRQTYAAADEARETYEYMRNDLRLKVQQEFDALKAGASRVHALEVALASADQVVLSNQKGVQAGTRTNLDVLNVEQQRFNTRVDLARARYQLLVWWATLLSYAGDLGREEISRINRALTEPLPLPTRKTS